MTHETAKNNKSDRNKKKQKVGMVTQPVHTLESVQAMVDQETDVIQGDPPDEVTSSVNPIRKA